MHPETLRPVRALVPFVALLLALVSPARAQSAEEAAVRATIDQLFTGMKTGDTSVVRQVFHPTARLQTALPGKDGQPTLQTSPIDAFVQAIGRTPRTTRLDERLLSYEIRVDDGLATVWTPYEFFVNDQFSHAGVNAFQLAKTAGGWRIIQICDTRRKTRAKP
jgi:hypothetical protein